MAQILEIHHQIGLFWSKIVIFKEEYKITVVDKTLVSNISKIKTDLYQNEGVIVFSIKCSQ